jgi:hypothetical protein
MTPNAICGVPSACMAKAGMMVCEGRRADLAGMTGLVVKPWPRFCRLMPVPGTTTPEPKPM